jgi:Loader and inhibitor of phage G40P
MTRGEAMQLVAILKAAFPRQPIEPETVKTYAAFLADLEVETATEAMKRLVASSRFFPTIAEIREEIAEQACGLPSELEAWELVARVSFDRTERRQCEDCAGSGYSDLAAETVCAVCNGQGDTPGWYMEKPTLPAEVARALDAVGGRYAVQTCSRQEVIRAQFRDAYRQIRAAAIRDRQTAVALPAGDGQRELPTGDREAAAAA